MPFLTRRCGRAVDDLSVSRRDPAGSPFANPFPAIDCSNQSVSTVEAYVRAGVAPATRRAYRADLARFEAWGGSIPATEDMVAVYIAEQATTLKVSTLTRCLAAISIAHRARGLLNPAVSPLVRATMRGIRRAHGAAQHQAKPLLREDLFVVLGALGDRLKDLRDRAVLLIGLGGGLGRAACRSPPSTGSWPARRGRKGSGSWDRLRRDPNNGFGEGRIPSGSGVWGAERGDMMAVAGPVGQRRSCSHPSGPSLARWRWSRNWRRFRHKL